MAFVNNSPDIKEDIKTHARTILRKLLISQIDNLDSIDSIDKQWISLTRVDFLVKPYSKTHQLLNKVGIENVSSISSIPLRKGDLSQIRRALPSKVLHVIDYPNTILDSNCFCYILCGDKVKDITKISSKELNNSIKMVLRKKHAYHPSDKYVIDKSFFGDIRTTWHNLWRIKNPTLRAIRLKVLYKDIWCQEKRFKLGIATDAKCTICGLTESATHQLFLCNNAKRIWEIGCKVIGTRELNLTEGDLGTLSRLIEVSPNSTNEIIKSVIFKLLIQIDRSSVLNETEIKRIMAHWLNIEFLSLSKVLKSNNALLTNLKRISSNLMV